jgi:hypothetical protein
MKIISLFTKAPSNQRFNYTPRFYDRQKEEMKERELRIKRDLELERGNAGEGSQAYRSRIAGSFQAARRRSKTSADALRSGLLRFGVLLFIVLFLIAFLQWGRAAMYSFIPAVLLYLYFKFKRKQ